MTGNEAARSPWIGKLSAFAVLALLCVGTYWLGSGLKHAWNRNGGLVVDDSSLNLGEIWEDKSFSLVLPVRNTSDRTIEVVRFRSSCACVGIAPESVLLPPGNRADLHLTLDLTKATQKEVDASGQDFRIQVAPQLKGGLAEEEGWWIQGKVRRQFVFSPPFLDFQDSLLRGRPFESRSLVVACASNVTKLSATCNESLATVEVKRIGSDPDTFDVKVRPKENLPSGPFSIDVRISAETTAGQTIRGTAQAGGTILEDVYAVPGSIALGARPLGDSCEESVLLQSRTGNEFRVTRFEHGPGDLSLTSLSNTPRGCKGFKISQRISKLGAQESQIVFHVLTSECPWPREITLFVTYHGISNGRLTPKSAKFNDKDSAHNSGH